MTERKKVDRKRLGTPKPVTQKTHLARRKKMDPKALAEYKLKIELENANLVFLGAQVKRKQEAEMATRESPRYKATAAEIARLSLKAIEIYNRQQAELMATLTTQDERDLLGSLGMCHNLISWLQTMLDTLENRTDIMDAPDFQQLLITCSMYLSQHEDDPNVSTKSDEHKTPGATAKFPLGRLRMSVGIAARVQSDEAFSNFIGACMRRHRRGDWGQVSEEGRKANEEALKHGNRLMSAYVYQDKTEIRIMTEGDHSVTTVLFPDEY